MGEPASKTEPFRREAFTVKFQAAAPARKVLEKFVRLAREQGLLATARLEEVFPKSRPGDKFAGLWTIEVEGAIDTLLKQLPLLDGVEKVHVAPQRRAVAR